MSTRSKNSYVEPYQKHTPASFCYLVKCFDDELYPQKIVTFTKQKESDDVAQIFVEGLRREVKEIYKFIKEREKKIKDVKNMIAFDQKSYDEADICHICKRPFIKNTDNIKVRDHCHLTGKFRGAAHKKCNLKYKIPKFIPVIFHNLSGYDCYLFIKQLAAAKNVEE